MDVGVKSCPIYPTRSSSSPSLVRIVMFTVRDTCFSSGIEDLTKTSKRAGDDVNPR